MEGEDHLVIAEWTWRPASPGNLFGSRD